MVLTGTHRVLRFTCSQDPNLREQQETGLFSQFRSPVHAFLLRRSFHGIYWVPEERKSCSLHSPPCHPPPSPSHTNLPPHPKTKPSCFNCHPNLFPRGSDCLNDAERQRKVISLSISTSTTSTTSSHHNPTMSKPLGGINDSILSKPLYAFNLPQPLLDALTVRALPTTESEVTPSYPAVTESIPPSTVAGASLTCQTCIGATFDGIDEQRAHFKSDWHRYNAKVALGAGGQKNQGVLTAEEFEEINDGEQQNLG